MLPLAYEALTVLAHILCELREFSAAWSLLDGIMPLVLENEDVRLTAECLKVMADACVGVAGGYGVNEDVEGKKKRVEGLGRALEIIERAHVGEYYTFFNCHSFGILAFGRLIVDDGQNTQSWEIRKSKRS